MYRTPPSHLTRSRSEDPIPTSIREQVSPEQQDTASTVTGDRDTGQATTMSDDWNRPPDRFTLLTSDSYARWKYDVEVVLLVRGLLNVTNGRDQMPERPPTTAPADEQQRYRNELKEWIMRDAKAREIIARSLDNRHHDMIRGCRYAIEMMDLFEHLYTQKSSTNVLFAMKEFHDCKWTKGDSVMSFYAKLRCVANKLESMKSKLDDTMLLSKVINEAPTRFQVLKESWEVSLLAGNQLKMEDLLGQMLRIEKTQTGTRIADSVTRDSKGSNQSDQRKGNSAFVQTGTASTHKRIPICFRCKRKGHVQRNCRTYFPNQASGSQVQDRKEEKKNADTRTHAGNTQSKGKNAISSWISTTSYDQTNDHESGTGNTNAIFVADSGATRHMSGFRNLFTDYVSFSPPKSLKGIGKGVALALGKGNVRMEFMMNGSWIESMLTDVFHVPDLEKENINLFSIGYAESKGCKISVQKGVMRITGSEGTLTATRASDNLYVMDMRTSEDTHAGLKVTSLKRWHERLSHISVSNIKQMKREDACIGFPDKFTDDMKDGMCAPCILGKMTRLPFQDAEKRECQPGEIIHTDVNGPMECESLGGSRYFLLIKCEMSGYRKVYPLKTKDQVVGKLRIAFNEIEDETGNRVRRLRSDVGTEYKNQHMMQLLEEKGITHEMSAPDTHEQNGLAERENRTLKSLALSMLEAKRLPKQLWMESVMTATHVLNRVLNRGMKNVTPYELWFGRKPDVSHLRTFGCVAYGFIPETQRKKWDAKAEERIFVGYSLTQKNYRLWDHDTNSVKEYKHVKFDEDKDYESLREEKQKRGRGRPKKTQESVSLSGSQTQHQTTANESNDDCDPASFFSSLTEPQTYTQAMNSEQRNEWSKGMTDEYMSLIQNGTWELVDPPADQQPIETKWIYKIKRLPDGSIDRFKARLVVKGFKQQFGVNFFETYAPVIRYDSIRVLLSIAAREDLEIIQTDVKTAFLHGDLNELIYVKQPEGFDDGSSKVCLLKRPQYGIKQAPSQWFKKMREVLLSLSFTQSNTDPCVFHMGTKERLLIGIYVDDAIMLGRDKHRMEEVLHAIEKNFEITRKEIEKFVGLEVSRNREQKMITISLSHYIDDVLTRFNMQDAKTKLTPADTHEKLTADMSPTTDEEREEMKCVPYRELVGAIGFISVTVRPDISFSVAQVSQFLSNPGRKHWEACKRILRYLKHTQNEGLVLGTNDEDLVALADSDFAGHPDNRKSTTGFALMLYGGCVSWVSRLQKVISLSSTESEYYAMGECVREVVWLRSLLSDLNISQSTTRVLNDNMSALRLVQNDEFRKRSKHIEVRHHYIREKQRMKEIVVEHIPTEEQAADLLTKNLTEKKLESCKKGLGITSISLLFYLTLLSCFATCLSFVSAPPVTWIEAKEDVLRGQTVFTYDLNIDLECHKFVVPEFMTHCLNRYQLEILDVLDNHCKGAVTQRQKRFEPITMMIIGGLGLAASIGIGVPSLGIGIASLTKVTKLEHEVESRLDKIYDVSDRILDQIEDVREQVNNMTVTLGERESELLKTTELSSSMAVFTFHLRTALVKFNQNLIDYDGLEVLNITIPSDVPVKSLKPISCNFSRSNKTIVLRFTGNNVDPHQTVLYASPFRLFHFEENKTCETVFNGSARVMYDTTPGTKCKVREVKVRDVYLHKTQNSTCKRAIESWTKGSCVDNMDRSKTIQYKTTGFGMYCYCYGNQIHIFDTTLDCPEFPFFIPVNETFKLDGESYVSRGGITRRLTPELLTQWQHTINAHVDDVVNPFEIHTNTKEIRKILHQEKESLHAKHKWTVGSLTTCLIVLTLMTTVYCLWTRFCSERTPSPPALMEMIQLDTQQADQPTIGSSGSVTENELIRLPAPRLTKV